jgi:hypothetical protein
VTVLAYSRSFWPLFLHVLGAMVLFGAVLAALLTTLTGHRRATFLALLVGVPAWVVMRVGAQWIYADEGKWPNNPTWITIGFNVADMGLIVFLLALGAAFWWQRRGGRRAGRVTAVLSGLYIALLAVAWLAMSGKWG